MPQESGADDAARALVRQEPPSSAGTPADGKPPRPGMSDVTPAPIRQRVVPTGAVKVSRSLWILSFALSLMVFAFAFLYRGTQLDDLISSITALEPDRDSDTISTVANLAFWCTSGALVVIVLIELLMMGSMLRRNGRARWGLLVVLLLHLGVAALADAFVLVANDEGAYFRLVLVAQLVLAGAALVASFLPSAGAWFRGDRSRTRRTRA